MSRSGMIIEEVTTPEAVEAARTRAEQGRSNGDWLERHWSDLLPQARGRFIAVAGSEAYVAETVQAAWGWVDENHPEDAGDVRPVRTFRSGAPHLCESSAPG